VVSENSPSGYTIELDVEAEDFFELFKILNKGFPKAVELFNESFKISLVEEIERIERNKAEEEKEEERKTTV